MNGIIDILIGGLSVQLALSDTYSGPALAAVGGVIGLFRGNSR